MRGFILSLDALISVGLLLSLAVFISSIGISYSNPGLEYERLYYVGKDTLNVMQNGKVGDLTDIQVVQDYFSQGILGDEDVNKSVLDVVGSLWASGNTTEAQNLSAGILGALLNGTNYGYDMLFDNQSIYSRDNNASITYLARLSTVASGYAVGEPVSGYMAAAWATRVKKNNTLVVPGDVITSAVRKPWGGNNQNKVNVTYEVNVPTDANITDAWWFIETAWLDNRFKAYINGEEIPGGGGIGSSKLTDLEEYLVVGNNTASVVSRYGSGGYEGGDDGATHFVVEYNTSQLQTRGFPKRFHFQTVISNCSIRYKKPVFVLGNISSLKVHINLSSGTQVQQVSLKFRWKGLETPISTKSPSSGVVEWNDTEIRSVLDTIGIGYQELTSRYFWFIADVDEYHEREYKDYERRIMGSDSYVEADYERPIPYSYIDITSSLEATDYSDEDPYVDDFYRYVEWEFSINGTAIPLDARWQFAWLYWSGWDPLQRASANSLILYNHDPYNLSSDPLIEEFARFGYSPGVAEGALVNGTNTFELQFSDGYSVNPENSLGTSTALIKATVGYGVVFPNESAATEDAVYRLNQTLGVYASVAELITDSQPISGVPSMWGPANLEIRVWA